MTRRGEHLHARKGQLVMGMVGGGAHDGAVPLAHWAPEGSKFGTAASIFCEMDVLIHQRHACTQRLRELGQACKGAAARGAGGAADVEPLRRALAQYETRAATAGGGAPFVLVGSCVAGRYARQVRAV